MIKLSAKELRVTKAEEGHKKLLKKNPIYIIVDNVLDTYNIGAIFRLADAVGVQKVYLCGQTEIPPNSRIKKASINTIEWVEWEYCRTAVEAIEKVRREMGKGRSSDRKTTSHFSFRPSHLQVVAIEQNGKSVPYDKADYRFPVALIVGHESDGISQEALDAADVIVEIPMWGVNKSLNVMVSLGIVLYEVMKKANEYK